MAEADKSQMDEEVRRALSGFKNLEWHTRTGAPHCVTDLESVAAGQAQTIILLHPELAQVSFVVSKPWVRQIWGVDSTHRPAALEPARVFHAWQHH